MKKLIKILSLIIIFVLAFSLVFAIRFAKKNNTVSKLKELLNEMEERTSSVKILHRRILAAKNVQNNQLGSLETLSTVIPLLKGSMRLSSFSMARNNFVVITGQAASNQDFYNFKEKILEQTIFQDVTSGDILKRNVRGKEVSIFKLEFQYVYPENRQVKP